MYVNQHFAARDLDECNRVIEQNPLATLVMNDDGVSRAAHVPFVLHRQEGEKGTLWAHVATRDPIARQIRDGAEAFVIFTGPRAYISPGWYENPGLPTWNFVSVHVRGVVKFVSDRAKILEHLAELANEHEARIGHQWSLSKASGAYVDSLLPHIRPLSVEIREITGKFRLSQNRSAGDREGVVRGLRALDFPESTALAAAMAGYEYSHSELRPLLDLSQK